MRAVTCVEIVPLSYVEFFQVWKPSNNIAYNYKQVKKRPLSDHFIAQLVMNSRKLWPSFPFCSPLEKHNTRSLKHTMLAWHLDFHAQFNNSFQRLNCAACYRGTVPFFLPLSAPRPRVACSILPSTLGIRKIRNIVHCWTLPVASLASPLHVSASNLLRNLERSARIAHCIHTNGLKTLALKPN